MHVHIFFTLALKANVVADLGYSMLIQDMAGRSAYFCEKAGAGGFIVEMLCTVQIYMNNLVAEVISISCLKIPCSVLGTLLK